MPPPVVSVLTESNAEFDITGHLEDDPGVPLHYCANRSLVAGAIRWRFGDNRFSMLELKIDPATGILFGVVIVLLDKVIESAQPVNLSSAKRIAGLPILDGLCAAPATRQTPEHHRVELRGQDVYVSFASEEPVSLVIDAGSLWCCVTHERLSGIICPSFPPNMLAVIRNCAGLEDMRRQVPVEKRGSGDTKVRR